MNVVISADDKRTILKRLPVSLFFISPLPGSLYICIVYTLKKSLGQHFLQDDNICRKIVAAVQEYPFRQLLEVGPGGGAITRYLIKIDSIDFKAVELDDEKATWILQEYPGLAGKISA